MGAAATQEEDLALGFIETHEVLLYPLLEAAYVSLDGILSIVHVYCSTQLGVSHRLAEGTFNSTVDVIDENIEEHLCQY